MSEKNPTYSEPVELAVYCPQCLKRGKHHHLHEKENDFEYQTFCLICHHWESVFK